MKKIVIDCQNISMHYGEGQNRCDALKNVNLSIEEGQLRLLMGPSGSGKTTLISIIAGILTQSSGRCLVNNIELSTLSDEKKVHYRGSHIGFVFQAFNLVPTLTSAENVSVPLLAKGVAWDNAIEQAKQMLAEVGLLDKVDKYPAELSGGQQQRLAIARAIIHKPPIIVCDEPTSFLDHQTGHQIMGILKEMVSKRNVTIIVVTHDPRIMEFADEIDHLEDGMIQNLRNK